jgi:hypothetical protein
LPRYRRIAAQQPDTADVTVTKSDAASPEPTPDAVPTYRELQTQAKAAGISARQPREDLEAALAKAKLT